MCVSVRENIGVYPVFLWSNTLPRLYWPKNKLAAQLRISSPRHIYCAPVHPFTRCLSCVRRPLSLSWRRLGDLPAPAALRQVPRSSSGPSPKSSQQVCAPLLFPSRCAKLRTQTLADTVLAICVRIGSNFRCIM